jgi:ABC-type glycerol-3-phosphate transport system permease component
MNLRLPAYLAGQSLLILWTLLALIPFALIVLLAFRDNTGIYTNPLGLGGTFHPENFTVAWKGPAGSAGMAIFLRNSVYAFLSALVVNLSLGATGAYFATRLSKRVSTLYLTVFLIGAVVPFVLLLIPYYQAFNAIGMLNNPIALGALYGILALPTTVLILNAYFVDFPNDLIEAAALDGLSDFKTYVKIVLPLSKGALTAVSVLLAIWVWSETQLAIVLLQSAGGRTAPVGILGFQGAYETDTGALFAALTIIAIPVLVFYFAFHRFIAKGIALGGVVR